MTVGQFNDSFKPIMDGVGLCVENYTRWIDAKYGTAYAVVPRIPKYRDNDSFGVVRYPSLPIPVMSPYRLGVPWASPRIGDFLTRTRFDLVHSHSPFVGGRMAERTAARHDIPHVSTFHTKYREDIRRFVHSERLAEIFVHRIAGFYSGCSAVWTPSEATKATLYEYGYEGEITVAPNGSDLKRPTQAQYAKYRKAGDDLSVSPRTRSCFSSSGSTAGRRTSSSSFVAWEDSTNASHYPHRSHWSSPARVTRPRT